MPVLKGARELLAYLKERGYPLALATSTDRATTLYNLKNAGFTDYFSGIVCGDMVENSKPAPDIYLAACASIQMDPGDCIALGGFPRGRNLRLSRRSASGDDPGSSAAGRNHPVYALCPAGFPGSGHCPSGKGSGGGQINLACPSGSKSVKRVLAQKFGVGRNAGWPHFPKHSRKTAECLCGCNREKGPI